MNTTTKTIRTLCHQAISVRVEDNKYTHAARQILHFYPDRNDLNEYVLITGWLVAYIAGDAETASTLFDQWMLA